MVYHRLVVSDSVVDLTADVVDYSVFIDEELKLIRKTEKALSQKYYFDIHDHVIQFFGICKGCKDKVEVNN